ncbi:MAG TPA: polyketide cyclase [Muricauda sp.]|uniref:SRPBCC family protein n=1 Tax=Flagellimonas aurea TaxID=2915619 RepID=UPI000C949BEF|nr:SRPBCC family protein [uncultured Allomuricauda sp.]MAO16685.1 polyketide cyclase [Allomuricauda sp.]HBU78835.1 polyketide cyclase [Allomuricauda sp.]|tara:strand:- start:169 stop:576 length:408 start_codon:yes stop_codon:yes gene_type:complete
MNRITVKVSVKADIDKVWNCWTDPEHITNWNFATDEWCCPKAENNLRPNEKFSWRMEAKDGSVGFDFEGTYNKIAEKEWISYKMSDGRKVDIEFTQNGNEIQVSETFDAEGTNSDELQRAGWQAILGNFKKYVES